MNASCYIVVLIEEQAGGYLPRFCGAGLFSEEKPTVIRNGRFVLSTVYRADAASYGEARADALAYAAKFFPWLPLDNVR